MYSRISSHLKRVFFALFLVFFLWVFGNAIFVYTQGFEPILSVFLMTVFTTLFFGSYAIIGRFKLSIQTGARVLQVFIVVMTLLQIVVGLLLRHTPAFDLDAIFNGGRDWALNGNFDRYQEYFGMFSINQGGLVLYKYLFTFGRLYGMSDSYALALIYNTLMLQVMVIAVYDTVRQLAGVRAAVLSLVMFGAFIPIYTMGAVFYTDLLSAPFVALCINCCLRVKHETRLKQKTIHYLVFGVFAAVGAILKFTVIIVAIAALFDLLLSIRRVQKLPLKRIVLNITIPVAAACITAALIFGFYGYMSTQQDHEIVSSKRMPITHWIMMGLSGNGYYNPADYDFSKGLPDLSARREEIPKIIGERMRELGFSGMFKLLTEKAATDFGDGTYHLSDFLDDGPVYDTPLHGLVLYSGHHYDVYKHIAQGAHLAFFLLMLIGGALSIVRPNRFIVPWLSMFGLLLFLIVWETSPRYTQNFMPVLILCAVMGVCSISDRPSIQSRSTMRNTSRPAEK